MNRTWIACLVIASACQDEPPAPSSELVDRLRAAGERAQTFVPEYAPLYTAVLSDARGADEAGLERAAPELDVLPADEAPRPGQEEFARPLVVLTDERALEDPVWDRLFARGGREVETDEDLPEGLELLVLRSVTGGPLPMTAQPSTYAALRDQKRAVFDPSDGDGRAWLESIEEATVRAGAPGRWELVYEAGPLGIAAGGSLFLQTSPFWGWPDRPQTADPSAPGYTRLESPTDEVELVPTELDGLLQIEIRGRALAPGERVHMTYGAGELGARSDSYAERGERLWIAVDGDGDGRRKVLPDSPRFDVLPREPARLMLTLPSTARPGDRVRLTVCVLDASLNTGLEVAAGVTFDDWPTELGSEPDASFTPEDEGRTAVEIGPLERGVHAVTASVKLEDGRRLTGTSNPVRVSASGPLIRWGDLHGHTNYSDGTGLPEDYFVYARDVAGLDVVALTDHDDWGLLPMSEHPWMWDENRSLVARFHEPGQFVTLLGFEWTNWIHGHRHVLYFGNEGEVLSSLDERFDTPQELWAALRGQDALTIPHHSAGLPVPTDWTIAPDPDLEPVVEVTSVHGTSEAEDAPRRVRGAQRGNFVRDALARGYRYGIIGSGDSHDGHPGLVFYTPHYFNGGLVAFLTEELTREGVRVALFERRVYATNGPRIVLRFALGGAPMGQTLAACDSADLYVYALGTADIERVDVIRSGAVAASLPSREERTVEATAELDDLSAGEFVYVRIEQADGGLAWSSPVFVE